MKILRVAKHSPAVFLIVGLMICAAVSASAQTGSSLQPKTERLGTGDTNQTAVLDTNQTAVPYTNTAIVPRLAAGFMRRHTNFVEIAKKGDIDVLFMGDSITDWWRQPPTNGGKAVFDKNFGDWKVANFGIAGDTTQGVLWRLQNGEGQGYKPKAIMLMIGTNNANNNRNTPPEIAEGVEAVIAELRKDFPDAKILLLAIFPRGPRDSDYRKKLAEVNERIAKLNDGKQVVYMDINSKFLDADGNFLPGVFRRDLLHPAEPGYEIWAQAVKEPLAKLMK